MPIPLKFSHILLGFNHENNIFNNSTIQEETDKQVQSYRKQIKNYTHFLTHLRNSKKVLQHHMKGDQSTNVVSMRKKTNKEISNTLSKIAELRKKIKARRKIAK